ncbi:PEP/pyruvate-binding domain-containing protein, partial [Streptomyces sp. NPDC059783]|uniref:PEP/pyruvate-binding domain-containing protein n=1 Tax=Streptomyces sp. NPDC059783 TaxID=3346944 RepID=UPI00366903F2
MRSLTAIDAGALAGVGGKAANLGALSRIDGVRVPAGFCVTTDAFRDATAHLPELDERLRALERLDEEGTDDAEATRALGAAIRRIIEEAPLPAGLTDEVTEALTALGGRTGYAVRSSATAEDLPTASFAGQQDTYLHVVGAEEVLRHIRRCWASLFTERAVVYRRRHGIGHRAVRMAVVVQEMVLPHASGILFTADPVTGDRTVATLDAGLGLGEALVSGLAEPDRYRVRRGEIVTRAVAPKHHALRARPGGGTQDVAVDGRLRGEPALTDEQVLRLVATGRRIEAHFGRPQDIEWCLADDDSFRVVQSRPITTLFPVPEADDDGNHVYVSVGHGQMMTDAMKPLGLSLWRRTALTPMREAGGRLFVDVTPRLAAPTARAALLEAMGRGDPLVGDALETVLDRGDFVPTLPDAPPPAPPAPDGAPSAHPDPSVVEELIERSRASLDALERGIRTVSGPALFDFLDEALAEQRALRRGPRDSRANNATHPGARGGGGKLGEWRGEK